MNKKLLTISFILTLIISSTLVVAYKSNSSENTLMVKNDTLDAIASKNENESTDNSTKIEDDEHEEEHEGDDDSTDDIVDEEDNESSVSNMSNDDVFDSGSSNTASNSPSHSQGGSQTEEDNLVPIPITRLIGKVTEVLYPEPRPIGVESEESSQVAILEKPIEGARVTARPRDVPIPIEESASDDTESSVIPPPEPLVYSTLTDRNGNYELELPAGSYIVEVSKEGYEKQMKQVLLNKGENKRLDFQLLKLPERLTGINGQVTELTAPEPRPIGVESEESSQVAILEKPIEGARVTARPRDVPIPIEESASDDTESSVIPPPEPIFFSTLTDRNGNYELELPAGSYIVEVSKEGYSSKSKDISLLSGEFKVLSFELVKILIVDHIIE